MRINPIILMLITALSSQADMISWTNTAGGNWNVAANWSPNQVPGAGDTAIITNDGSYTVTLNASTTLAGLELGAGSGTQILAQAANTLTLNGPGAIGPNGRYNWSGGTLAGTNVVDVSGVVNWSGGNLNADAALSIATNGLLSASGAGLRYLNGSLTNGGVVQFSAGNWRVNDGLLHNLPGGLFDFQSDVLLDNYSGSPVFVNQGTIRKSAGTGTATCDVALRNTGRLEAGSGTLAYGSGSVFSTGTVFAGAGTNLLNALSDSTLDGVLTAENLVWDGAALGGSGTLAGLAVWKSGTLSTGGSLSIATNGQLSVSGSGLKALNGSLTNGGVVQYSGSTWRVNSGLLHNLPGSLFDFQSDAMLDNYSGLSTFVNEGTIRKSAGTGTATCDVPLRNTGRLEAASGTLVYGNGNVFSIGTVFAGAGTNLLNALSDSTLDGVLTAENLVWDGATLGGSGTLVGFAMWKSGTLSIGASLSIATNGQLSVSGASAKNLNGSLTNGGVVQYSGSTWRVNGALLHNLPGSVFDFQADVLLVNYSGSPTFVNQGTIRKSAGTGTATCGVPLQNTGRLEAQVGSLSLPDGSVFGDGTAFLGAGTNLLASGTVNIAGEVKSENAVLNGATLNGAGSFLGSLTWLSGTIAADMSLTVPTNGYLRMLGAGLKSIRGGLTNAGVITWLGTGDLRVGGGVLYNLPSGLFDCQNNELLDLYSGSPVFVNEGTFRKSVGTGTNVCQLPFTNRGRVEVNAGTMSFTGAFTDQAGSIVLGGGTLQTAKPFAMVGGQLNGIGTLKPGSGSTAALTSAATVAPAPNGTLTIQGSYTQLLGGSAEFTLGGISAGTNHSQLVVSGAATLRGCLNLIWPNNYAANPGDAFKVMKFASVQGDFDCFNGLLLLGRNLRLTEQFTTTNLTLVTTSAVDPTNFTPKIVVQYPTTVVCWPAEFWTGGFTNSGFYWSTNLTTTNWTLCPGVTNRYVETNMEPAKFFRIME
jgi:hypothetical protein